MCLSAYNEGWGFLRGVCTARQGSEHSIAQLESDSLRGARFVLFKRGAEQCAWLV